MLLDQQVVARVLAAFLRKLDHEIRKEMKLPEDNHDKHVAICTFNNVIDRMQEHVEAIRDGKETNLALTNEEECGRLGL